MNKKIIKENMAIVVMAALGAVLAAFVLVVWNSPLNLAYRLAFSAFAGCYGQVAGSCCGKFCAGR